MLSTDDAATEAIAAVFTARTGVELRSNRHALVRSRLTPRLRKLGIATFREYKAFLERHLESEIVHVISLLTTHKTDFFRESGHFTHLLRQVVEKRIATRQPISIWSAASSSGEEAYSIAMVIAEALRAKGFTPAQYAPGVRVVGTDVDPQCVAKARNGVYPVHALRGMNATLRDRYFKIGDGDLAGFARAHDDIHGICSFSTQNLVKDQVIGTAFDAVFCRNVFIYFSPETIRSVVERLSDATRESGFLYVGYSEALPSAPPSLAAAGNSVYQRVQPAPATPVTAKGHAANAESAAPPGKIKVLIIDDARTVRAALRSVIGAHDGFEIVADVDGTRAAADVLRTRKVDVVTLDINMPEESGIQYLERLTSTGEIAKHPPVVIISSVNPEESEIFFRCIELGACAYLEKPALMTREGDGLAILETLRGAAELGRQQRNPAPVPAAKAPASLRSRPHGLVQAAECILLGASTGGTVAIAELLKKFPKDFPPVIVVQHLPGKFAESFAQNLKAVTGVDTVVAATRQKVERSRVYIVPGGLQGQMVGDLNGVQLELRQDPPMNRHLPSVDYLFRSAVPLVKKHPFVAILLTGMGEDGAREMLSLHKAGVTTICQDKSSSVVFGMPRAAIELGAASHVLPLAEIPGALFSGAKAVGRLVG